MENPPHVPPARLVRNDVGIYVYDLSANPSRLDILVINAIAQDAELDEVYAQLRASSLVQENVRRKGYLFSVYLREGETWDDQVEVEGEGRCFRWQAVAALIPSTLGWQPDFITHMGSH